MFRYLIATFLLLSCSLTAVEFPLPKEVAQEDIENSLIHYALQQAHEKNDFTLLDYVLKHASIECRTEQTELVDEDSSDRQFHVGWEEGITPLEYAIRLQNPELVQLLIYKGASVDNLRREHRTWRQFSTHKKMATGYNYFAYSPLYVAVLKGNPEIVNLLLTAGANPQEIFDSRVRTNAIYCVFLAHLDDIYSAKRVAAESGQDHLIPLIDQYPSQYPKGPISTLNRNPSLQVNSIEENEVVLSNQWTILMDTPHAFFGNYAGLQILSQGILEDGILPDFIYIKKSFEIVEKRLLTCGFKTIPAVLIDPTSATYQVVETD